VTLWGTVCIFTLTLYIHVGDEDRGVISTGWSWLLAGA
jgi:hypothetical protein